MLTDIHRKEIENLYATPIAQQTAFWSVVKKRLGASTLAVNFKSKNSLIFNSVEDESSILSDISVIIRRLDSKNSIAYVPYGPELEPDEEFQGMFLEELSESLRDFLPKDCIMIRYDLCWESYWAKETDFFDTEGVWIGEPAKNTQEMRFNFNTINWNFKKAYYNILPSNTIYLDLTPDTDVILNRMRSKTRYNIGLSQRKGVNVVQLGLENLDIWYSLYQETARRNRILINDIKYFETVLSSNADNTESPAKVYLLAAVYDRMPLAAMFLIITGHRGSYLYGASSSEHRNLMATYALQWEAIKISKAMGCTEYDMFGVSPGPDPSHPLYGLYKFKIGFGGDLYHGLGCWDYPLKPAEYNQFISSELNSQGFHLNN
ncbi:Methicillin Resistance Protein [Bacteroidales bacterium CF]|jgi:Uncharacterized protein involved in methicillin resistance|nr:Methicillin Resistance Protein [Bacteroidales bacterium CF]